jgi:hypothetical protein
MKINREILEEALSCLVGYAEPRFKYEAAQLVVAAVMSFNDLEEELTKANTEKVKDGYVLVPIVPTDEMIEELTHEWHTVGANSMYDNYTAMIKAASKTQFKG